MIIFEKPGLKKNVKIIFQSEGFIIQTRGAFGTTYKNVVSKRYHEVRYVNIDNKFIMATITIDDFVFNVSTESDAVMIKNLLHLGKVQIPEFHSLVGTPDEEIEMESLNEDEVEKLAQKNQFVKTVTRTSPFIAQNRPVTPPAVPAFSFFALIEGQQQGPYNREQFKRLVDAGMVTEGSYVWKEGMANWALANTVEETRQFFARGMQTPPPPPPIQ